MPDGQMELGQAREHAVALGHEMLLQGQRVGAHKARSRSGMAGAACSGWLARPSSNEPHDCIEAIKSRGPTTQHTRQPGHRQPLVSPWSARRR